MTYTDEVLIKASNPQSSQRALQARKTWESRSPEEQVFASRQVLHGAIAPIFSALAKGEPVPANIDTEQFEGIVGMLDATLAGYEKSRARQMSGSSQQSG